MYGGCWQQFLPICTVARGTVIWIITLCAVGSTYYQYARYYGVVARGTVNWIITLCAVGSSYYQYAAVITNMHGSTGYRKLDYYTVCCWLLLLQICTVARGTVNWIITLCAVGRCY